MMEFLLRFVLTIAMIPVVLALAYGILLLMIFAFGGEATNYWAVAGLVVIVGLVGASFSYWGEDRQ